MNRDLAMERWSVGQTLQTSKTAGWSEVDRAKNDEVERRLVFADFHATDEGKGRRLIAQCQDPEDARLIVWMLDFIQKLPVGAAMLKKFGESK